MPEPTSPPGLLCVACEQTFRPHLKSTSGLTQPGTFAFIQKHETQCAPDPIRILLQCPTCEVEIQSNPPRLTPEYVYTVYKFYSKHPFQCNTPTL